METLQRWLGYIKAFLDFPVANVGQNRITLWSVLYFVILIVLLFYLAGRFKKWLLNRALPRTRLDLSARQAVASVIRYIAILVGFLVILQTVGIDLTTLNVIAGALAVGVGFGLQNIANNFISGLIILFERPIKMGDRIEVGEIEGEVIEIGGRSTKVLTNDNITVIVPNSKFITETVVNWMYTTRAVRFKIPVTVAYGSDLKLVERLLLEAAAENPDVMNDPPPGIRLLKFGDNGLCFELRVWSSTLVHRKGLLTSSLNFAIYEKLTEHEIEMPFPQRDIRIRSGSFEVNDRPDGLNSPRQD